MRMGGSSEGVSGDSSVGNTSLKVPPAWPAAEAPAALEPAGEAAGLPELPLPADAPPQAASTAPPSAMSDVFRKVRRPSWDMFVPPVAVTSARSGHPGPARPARRAGPAVGSHQAPAADRRRPRPGGLSRPPPLPVPAR